MQIDYGPFQFSLVDGLYVVAGIIIAFAILWALWGGAVYLSANRNEDEWQKARISMTGGATVLVVMFVIWALVRSIWG